MSRKWISFPLREGDCSRQAHCDLPQDTYEREMGREGFFGPTAHLHHKHAPTGWIDWEGPLRPHAFDFNEVPRARLPAGCATDPAQCRRQVARLAYPRRHAPPGAQRRWRRAVVRP